MNFIISMSSCPLSLDSDLQNFFPQFHSSENQTDWTTQFDQITGELAICLIWLARDNLRILEPG